MDCFIQLSAYEIRKDIPYSLICETWYGASWNTMRRKRRWAAEFTLKERDAANRLFHQSYRWTVGTGVPDKVRMLPETYILWQRLGDFCRSI